jgi:short-subunit dehydrogenase
VSALFRSVVVTGASRGIGAALARALAAPGARLLLIARDEMLLGGVAEDCRAHGGEAEIAAVDVTDAEALGAAILAFDGRSPVDLVIANAGVSGGLGPGRTAEPVESARRQLRVNLEGPIATATPLIEPMRARGRGQIALVASIAGFQPLPDTPAYSASKAGLIAWGRAADAWLRPQGIAVSVICPGFVESEMSGRYRGWKPLLMPADRAARIILRGLAKRKPLIAFPWPLVLAARAARLVPRGVEARIMQSAFKAEVETDLREESSSARPRESADPDLSAGSLDPRFRGDERR